MNVEQVEAFVYKTAEMQDWDVTPFPGLLESLIDGLRINMRRYGFLQCPCRDSFGTVEKDRDIACPCRYAESDISEYSRCYCGLFTRKDRPPSEVESIPDRRPEERYPE